MAEPRAPGNGRWFHLMLVESGVDLPKKRTAGVAKSFWYRLFSRDGAAISGQFLGPRDSLAADGITGARFFTLYSSIATRSDAATSLPGDHSGFTLNLDPMAAIRVQQAGHLGTFLAVPADAVSPSDVATQFALAGVDLPQADEAPAGDGHNATMQSSVQAMFDDARSSFAGFSYGVSIASEFNSILVFDAHTKQLMTGGPSDRPELGAGDDDVLILSGDYSDGFTIPAIIPGIDRLVVTGGNDYDLSVTDDFVAAGHTLVVDAMPLGAGHGLSFDGSRESDGAFTFFGSGGDDNFIGGAGDDRIAGLGGSDILDGGAGDDVFVYSGAGDSTGVGHDVLVGFDPAHDRIDLPGSVSGFDAAVTSGSLSTASFDGDLAALLGGLGAGRAAWLSADAGDLAGRIFLIVDGNGQAGYQSGQDYVFEIQGAPLADLTGHGGIFV